MGTFPEARAHALQRSAPLKHCTSSGFALLCDSQHRHRKAEATARFSASNWSINSGTSGTFPSDAAEFLASLHDMSLIGLSDRYTLWRVRTSPEFDCTEFLLLGKHVVIKAPLVRQSTPLQIVTHVTLAFAMWQTLRAPSKLFTPLALGDGTVTLKHRMFAPRLESN